MQLLIKILKVYRMVKWKLKFGVRLTFDGRQSFHKYTNIIIDKDSAIKIGKHICTYSNVHLTACDGGKMSIGNNCFFNRGCIVICRDNITIGNHVSFGPNVAIFDHNHKFDYDGIKSDEYRTGEVVIGDNCWIGTNVIILKNCHIGEGAVIGAGVVIDRDIPAHSIVKSNREMIIEPIRHYFD